MDMDRRVYEFITACILKKERFRRIIQVATAAKILTCSQNISIYSQDLCLNWYEALSDYSINFAIAKWREFECQQLLNVQ